jgi:signal transduction histidine kinase
MDHAIPTEDLGDIRVLRSYARLLARYERLMEISRVLSSTLHIDRLLEQIVRAAAELTDSEAASILLIDERTDTLRFEAAIDTTGFSLSSLEVPREGSIAGWIVTHGEPLLIADVSVEPRWASQVDEATGFVTRNLLGVPMRVHDRAIGALEAVNKVNDQAYTDEDVNTLTTLAAQAAIAIENARLFQQSDLIAEMVHELRTPLAAISATTHVLVHPELTKERHDELVQMIEEEARRLTRMTSEFLHLARLESGRTHIARIPVDIIDLVRECVQTVAPQAANRGVHLSMNIGSVPMPTVLGDREKLKQVLLNLLTNAIKYNREDGRVTVTAESVDRGIAISVQDTGCGISKENLPHIFEKFYRVADTEGYTQGTGLGLAIARRIVEAHNGRMSAESVYGEGSTFCFTLPLPPKKT